MWVFSVVWGQCVVCLSPCVGDTPAIQLNLFVNFAEKPGAPYDLKIIEARARSVLLGFTPGSSGRAPILRYTIKYNNDSFYDPVSARWQTLMVVQDAHLVWNLLPLTLPNLKPYTGYRFRVIASNKVGSSSPSNTSKRVSTLATGKKTRVGINNSRTLSDILVCKYL